MNAPAFGTLRAQRNGPQPSLRRLHPILLVVLFPLFLQGAASLADQWPQWRGPARDGHAAGETIVAEQLREPSPLWRIAVGGGFASPIVAGGRVIYLDEDGRQEVAHAVDAQTGQPVWKTPFAEVYQDEWGAGPRSTPFTDGERVFVQACNGEFRCLDFATGKVRWGFSFGDYGAKFLGSKAREGTATRRGNNGSGLLDGDSVILPVGSVQGASLVCLDKVEGRLRWKTGEDEAAYSSLMVADIAGARQVIAFTADALLGADRITGKILWRVPLKTNAKRHTMTPVVMGNRILVTSHTFGTICFEVSQRDGQFTAREFWSNPDLKINLATPVFSQGFLYSHGASKNLVCFDAATGKERWSQPGFGQQYSSTLAAGGQLLVLTDEGEAALVQASPEKYVELARTQIAGKNWSHPALAAGRLYVRDQRELICYAVR